MLDSRSGVDNILVLIEMDLFLWQYKEYTDPTAEADAKVEPRRPVEPCGSPPPEDVGRTRGGRTVVRGPTARPPAARLGTRKGTKTDSTIITGIDERTTGQLPVWMPPKQVSNWLSRTQDNKFPTRLIERLQRSPDPITRVNELIEQVRSKLVENYDIPDPLTQPSSSGLPREVEFSEPDQERRSNCSPRS